MTRKEMTNERSQSDVRINSAERGGIGRSQIESLFKTHYTQMYHLALTLLFDEAESKDVVSDVFASLLSGKAAIKREQSEMAHVLQSMPQGEKLHYGLVLCNVYKRGIQKVEFTIKK